MSNHSNDFQRGIFVAEELVCGTLLSSDSTGITVSTELTAVVAEIVLSEETPCGCG